MQGNKTEMAHFAALAKSWWNPRGPQRILHKMNNMRMDFINSTLGPSITDPNQNTSKLTVLDIGCGGGLLSESLARRHYVQSVLGIDVTPEVLAVANSHKLVDPKLTNLKYELRSVMDLESVKQSAEKPTFDIVTMFEVLEHLDDPKEALKLAMSKSSQYVFLSTINRTLAAYISTIALGEYVLNIVPPGTHTWSKYINATELESYVLGSGVNSESIWDVEKLQGCIYLPGTGWVRFDDQSKSGIEQLLNKVIGTDNGNYLMALKRRC